MGRVAKIHEQAHSQSCNALAIIITLAELGKGSYAGNKGEELTLHSVLKRSKKAGEEEIMPYRTVGARGFDFCREPSPRGGRLPSNAAGVDGSRRARRVYMLTLIPASDPGNHPRHQTYLSYAHAPSCSMASIGSPHTRKCVRAAE